MALLDVRHVSFTYPGQSSPAVEDVSFSVEKGQFVTLCGATGSGKSTLLRLLKNEIMPLGAQTGEIYLHSISRDQLPDAQSAYAIGYVMQRPEQQIVTDKVWHELAFGLENMGVPQHSMTRRVAEMAAYFGIENWFDRQTSTLSGGQKQLLNLASVMVMQPDILILDEPTAQLDPIAAADFIATLHKINRDLGTTILITEHRLEEVIPLSDRLLVLEKGRLAHFDAPRTVLALLNIHDPLLQSMPASARLYHLTNAQGECPLTVREGREYLHSHFDNRIRALPAPEAEGGQQIALSFRHVHFRYDRHSPDVMQDLNLEVNEGEIFCLLGGNGSGKSTLLRNAAGLLKPYAGEIYLFGKRLRDYKNQSLYRNMLTLLPQDVQALFLHHTLREELADAMEEAAMLPGNLTALLDQHPYDLSGGQQQLAGLAKVLATHPRILLMDEPTKGIDAYAREQLLTVLQMLKKQGITLLIVTHDVEFAARCADRCALLFRGQIVSTGAPAQFFSESSFYTTAVSRMSRGHYDRCVTVQDAAALCSLNGRKEESA